MAISLSSARVSQITQVLTKFTIDFSKPISPTNTAENILSVFDKDIHWYDHGFFVCRIGHEAVLGLNKAFLHCNQPFEPEINAIYPTPEGGVIEMIWKGCCTNDIVRPDGTVIMKGSGKTFVTHVCFVVKISEEGKIIRIDEYDHRYWDEGRGEAEYVRMTTEGASLKGGL